MKKENEIEIPSSDIRKDSGRIVIPGSIDPKNPSLVSIDMDETRKQNITIVIPTEQ